MNRTYLAEELFEDIPGDPDNVLLNLPPEVCDSAGLKPGDTIHIEFKEGQLILKKV